MMPLCSEILAFDPPFVRNSSMVKVEFTSGNPISGWKVMLPILSVFSSSSMQDARINAMQVKDTHAAPKCNLFIKWGIGPSVYGLVALGKRKSLVNFRGLRIPTADQSFGADGKKGSTCSFLLVTGTTSYVF